MRSFSPTLLQPTSSTNSEEIDQDIVFSTEQESISPMFDNDDLTRKVEECFRHNNEQQFEDYLMEIDQPSQSKEMILI
jgi:hypothetical protein